MKDQIIVAVMAAKVQAKAAEERVLFAWIIQRSGSGRFLARFATTHPTIYVLQADTLERLRAMLPLGLVCSERQPVDSPEVVEIWFSLGRTGREISSGRAL